MGGDGTVVDSSTRVMFWRVVETDSENLDGIAPVCPRQDDPAGPHDWYEPGVAMGFDKTGVYDCCPEPIVEIGSRVLAARLVELLNGEDLDRLSKLRATNEAQAATLRTVRELAKRWTKLTTIPDHGTEDVGTAWAGFKILAILDRTATPGLDELDGSAS